MTLLRIILFVLFCSLLDSKSDITAETESIHTNSQLLGISSESKRYFYSLDVNGLFEPVEGYEENGFIIHQDMILGHKDELQELGPDQVAGAAVSTPEYLWPRGIIPVKFSDELPESLRAAALSAMSQWSSKTIVQFLLVEEFNKDIDQRYKSRHLKHVVLIEWNPNYICRSQVGYRGSRPTELRSQSIQTYNYVSLGENCEGTALHELGHTIGLLHEHTRQDRSEHVTIIDRSIESGMEAQFAVNPHARSIGSYDFESVMHYGLNDFAVSDVPTIAVNSPADLPEGTKVGAMNQISDGDINSVLNLYHRKVSNRPNPIPGLDFEQINDHYLRRAKAIVVEISNQETEIEENSDFFDGIAY